MMPSSKLVLTAAGEFLISDIGLAQGSIAKAIEYYSALEMEMIVALAPGGKEKLSDYGFEFHSRVKLVEVPSGTKGALATAVCAISMAGNESDELHIAAGDTYFTGDSALLGIEELRTSSCEAGTLVFSSQDVRHSFVALDSDGGVQLVAEKSQIGPNATSGNFYFSNSKDFLQAANWCFVNNSSYRGNYYVSGALNFFVYQGKQVGVSFIEPSEVQKHWASQESKER